ncbi:MAG: hypothetical protein ACRC6M_11200 [Microcystaceae cyanobacterium]
MTFNINLLNNLDYDQAANLIEDYIDALIELFKQSPEGSDHAKIYPEIGNWTDYFVDFGYRYEGFTLSTITREDVKLVMEELLPRKITVFTKADAEDAIPELVAFWAFLEREYQFNQAQSIIKYLLSIKNKFPSWMIDPARGGLAKSFFMGGVTAGFDMTTSEGVNEFKDFYNAQLSRTPKTPKKPKKGFGNWTQNALPKRKKK